MDRTPDVNRQWMEDLIQTNNGQKTQLWSSTDRKPNAGRRWYFMTRKHLTGLP